MKFVDYFYYHLSIHKTIKRKHYLLHSEQSERTTT